MSFSRRAHVLYLPEGAGKSQLATYLARSGTPIVFACQSWKQVEEKYKEFSAALADTDIAVDVAYSMDGLLRKSWKVQGVRKEHNGPFHAGDIDFDETWKEIARRIPRETAKEKLRSRRKHFRVWVEFMKSVPNTISDAILNFSDHDPSRIPKARRRAVLSETVMPERRGRKLGMILTTFQTVRLADVKNDVIPKRWVVWFDDPGLSDILDIHPVEDGKQLPEDKDGYEKINDRWYYSRDPDQSLGVSSKNHCEVYTTTEFQTVLALRSHLPRHRKSDPIIFDKMEHLDAGRITILGTSFVRRRLDAIIPVLIRRLEKEKVDVSLIANGVGSKLNHSNSRGLNTLTETNIVAEVSVPHRSQPSTYCDNLRLDRSEHEHEVSLNIMVDQIHQAVGRNAGYRDKGFETVVLVDPKWISRIKSKCRYYIDSTNSVDIDRKKSDTRRHRYLDPKAHPIARRFEEMFATMDNYIGDKRKINVHVDHVIESIKPGESRWKYVARLLAALTTLCGVRFDSRLDSTCTLNPPEKNYRDLGERILDKWIPAANRKSMLAMYVENVRRKEGAI